jgi:hypothetical protein
MFDIIEFFDDPLRLERWFKGSYGSVLGVTIREIDIVPLLMELIWDFHGFVHVVVSRVKIIRSELDLHTIRRPWPLEDG